MVPNCAKHLNSANEPSLLALVKASHSTIIFVTAITTIFEENSNMQRGTFYLIALQLSYNHCPYAKATTVFECCSGISLGKSLYKTDAKVVRDRF